jgi:hypothetical protein
MIVLMDLNEKKHVKKGRRRRQQQKQRGTN